MKKPGQTRLTGGLLLGLALLLFAFPGESAQGARQGVSLCAELIIPSLFPFFVLSSLLIATGLAELCARPLGRLLSPLFGTSGAGLSALVLGLVGGYPVGARTLAQLAERKACSPKELRRLSLFCNNCGPAFFVGAAGVGVFGCREAGFLLLGANLLSAVLLGMILHFFLDSKDRRGNSLYSNPECLSLSQALPDCISAAFSSTLGVCAYVILFSVLTALADCSGLLPFCVNALAGFLPGEQAPALCRSLLMGLMEISTGTAALREGTASPAALPLAAFLLGWGGLSVHCQSLPYWRQAGVPVGPYLGAKLVQGLLSAGLTALGASLFPLSLPVMASTASLVAPSLLRRELLALWALSGIYSLLPKKRGGKAGGKPV